MYSSVCMLASPQGLFVWSTKCQKKKNLILAFKANQVEISRICCFHNPKKNTVKKNVEFITIYSLFYNIRIYE